MLNREVNMQGIILYKSKYGATKKYAEWLQETLSFDCADIREFNTKQLIDYNTVILCGGIYASGIACMPFLKKNYKLLSAKRLAILCVGASPYDENAFTAIKEHNLKNEYKDIPLFYGRGMWKQSEMKFIDRTLCNMLQKVVAKKEPSTYEPWEKALLCAVGQNCDWTDKSYIKPIVDWCLQ